MTVETLRHFFGWCAVINYALMMLWFGLHIGAHGLLTGLSERFFNVSGERYDDMTLSGMLYFKLANFMFFAAPYIALRVMS